MRFVVTSPVVVPLEDIGRILTESDSDYSLEDGILKYAGEPYASVEVSPVDSEIFSSEIQSLKEALENYEDDAAGWVVTILDSATNLIAIEILFGERELDETLERIEPVLESLFETYEGLLQVDGEGYYDDSGIILEME
jgi:hypothetical protein